MTEALVNNMYDVMIKEGTHSSVIGIIDQNSANHGNNDKKDPEGGVQSLQRNSSLRKFINTRSKSSKIGIAEHASNTIGTYETQTTLTNERNNPKRQEQPKINNIETPDKEPPALFRANTKPDIKRKDTVPEIEIELSDPNLKRKQASVPARTLPSLEQITKTISILEKRRKIKNETDDPNRQEQQEEKEPKELETSQKEPSQISKSNTKEDNEIIEIELEPGGQSPENNQFLAPDQAQMQPSLEPRFKLDVSFKEWLFSFFRPQLQVKILEEAEELLSQNLDIVTVARNIAEINKLKECLLNDQQRILFDNLPHSFVLLDPVTRKKSLQVEGGDGRVGPAEENVEKKVKEVYRELKESENKSALDSKLLSLYEKKCINVSTHNKDNG